MRLNLGVSLHRRDMSHPLDQSALCTLALEAGAEDYTGLYEVIWELNGKFPEVSEAEKIGAARVALMHLLSEGLIEVYRTEWPPSVYQPLVLSQALQEMQPESAWQMSQESPKEFLAVGTTARGEAELARGLWHQSTG